MGPDALHETLPARAYGDTGVYELERHAVFGRHWLLAGFRVDLREPGDYVTLSSRGLVDRRGPWDDDGSVARSSTTCAAIVRDHFVDSWIVVSNPAFVCRYHGWSGMHSTVAACGA